MPSDPDTVKHCGNPDCKVVDTGKCVKAYPSIAALITGRPQQEPEFARTEVVATTPIGIVLPAGDD